MFTKNSLATLFTGNLVVSYWRKIQWRQTEQKVMTRLGAGFLVLIPLVLTILVGRFVYIWVEDFMAPFLETLFRRPCLLYTSPSPRDGLLSRMPSSA